MNQRSRLTEKMIRLREKALGRFNPRFTSGRWGESEPLSIQEKKKFDQLTTFPGNVKAQPKNAKDKRRD